MEAEGTYLEFVLTARMLRRLPLAVTSMFPWWQFCSFPSPSSSSSSSSSTLSSSSSSSQSEDVLVRVDVLFGEIFDFGVASYPLAVSNAKAEEVSLSFNEDNDSAFLSCSISFASVSKYKQRASVIYCNKNLEWLNFKKLEKLLPCLFCQN